MSEKNCFTSEEFGKQQKILEKLEKMMLELKRDQDLTQEEFQKGMKKEIEVNDNLRKVIGEMEEKEKKIYLEKEELNLECEKLKKQIELLRKNYRDEITKLSGNLEEIIKMLFVLADPLISHEENRRNYKNLCSFEFDFKLEEESIFPQKLLDQMKSYIKAIFTDHDKTSEDSLEEKKKNLENSFADPHQLCESNFYTMVNEELFIMKDCYRKIKFLLNGNNLTKMHLTDPNSNFLKQSPPHSGIKFRLQSPISAFSPTLDTNDIILQNTQSTKKIKRKEYDEHDPTTNKLCVKISNFIIDSFQEKYKPLEKKIPDQLEELKYYVFEVISDQEKKDTIKAFFDQAQHKILFDAKDCFQNCIDVVPNIIESSFSIESHPEIQNFYKYIKTAQDNLMIKLLIPSNWGAKILAAYNEMNFSDKYISANVKEILTEYVKAVAELSQHDQIELDLSKDDYMSNVTEMIQKLNLFSKELENTQGNFF